MEICFDGINNGDGDSLVDCADPDCSSISACTAAPTATESSCNNGSDDDGDGKVDCSDGDCKTSDLCIDTSIKCNDNICEGDAEIAACGSGGGDCEVCTNTSG